MPNRIIKDSICTSDSVADMTDFEFRLWVGLITQADDAGRGDARPAIIKGRVFPLRKGVTEKNVDDALHGLASKGCISLYTVGGKPFFWFPTWQLHQRVRDVKPKYPSPDDADEKRPSAAVCGNPPQAAAVCGLNPIQSEYNPNPNPGDKRTRFAPPTVDEIRGFCKEQGLAVDADRFIAYYTSNGWMVGKVKMRDWRASVRSWALRDTTPNAGGKSAGKTVEQQQYTQREYVHTENALDAMMARWQAEQEESQ